MPTGGGDAAARATRPTRARAAGPERAAPARRGRPRPWTRRPGESDRLARRTTRVARVGGRWSASGFRSQWTERRRHPTRPARVDGPAQRVRVRSTRRLRPYRIAASDCGWYNRPGLADCPDASPAARRRPAGTLSGHGSTARYPMVQLTAERDAAGPAGRS